MDLDRVFVTQWRLRNPSQLPSPVEAVREGAPFPPVLLAEMEDGTVFIQDGHHRCLAFVLAGWKTLRRGDYTLLLVDHARPMRGRLIDAAVVRRLLGTGR